MKRTLLLVVLCILLFCSCSSREKATVNAWSDAEETRVMSAEGKKIRMIADNTEIIIVLNDSSAASDILSMLPLEMTLIERNSFAKGMTIPRRLVSDEGTTRSYQIGDFGYWDAGPDLAIFYDDIYERTIVPVIPLGRAQAGAESIRNEVGRVRLELVE